jgi:hypothetical protein
VSSRVVSEGEGVVLCDAIATAVEIAEIAEKSQIAIHAQKQAVETLVHPLPFSSSSGASFILLWYDSCVLAYEQSLSEGLRTECRVFHMTFMTEDQMMVCRIVLILISLSRNLFLTYNKTRVLSYGIFIDPRSTLHFCTIMLTFDKK